MGATKFPENDSILESRAEIRRVWDRTVVRLEKELARLDTRERVWMAERLARIARLQEELQELFSAADGEELCRRCSGACCDCGRNHPTLVTLLGFLLAGEPVPEPDFDRPCPFLQASGCRLDAARRPFNCVTFVCDPIEERLRPAAREDFYAREARLRSLYGAFARRYAGAGPSGILLRARRLGERPLLGPAVTA